MLISKLYFSKFSLLNLLSIALIAGLLTQTTCTAPEKSQTTSTPVTTTVNDQPQLINPKTKPTENRALNAFKQGASAIYDCSKLLCMGYSLHHGYLGIKMGLSPLFPGIIPEGILPLDARHPAATTAVSASMLLYAYYSFNVLEKNLRNKLIKSGYYTPLDQPHMPSEKTKVSTKEKIKNAINFLGTVQVFMRYFVAITNFENVYFPDLAHAILVYFVTFAGNLPDELSAEEKAQHKEALEKLAALKPTAASIT